MNLPKPLFIGKLIKRYKRFLADIELDSGEAITAHCANSGSMLGLADPGSKVILSISDNPKRKLPYTWELVRVGKIWACVNTLVPNRLVKEALQAKIIPELAEYSSIKPEAKWGDNSRLDFLLKEDDRHCYVEVKNVTLEEAGIALFPDAVTERGLKHLNELMKVVDCGHRAVMLFLVNRGDCNRFKPATKIDPKYAATLQKAYAAGVEILVYRTKINPPAIEIDIKIEAEL